MKTLKVIAAILAVLTAVPMPAFAATTQNTTVSAAVDQVLSLDMSILPRTGGTDQNPTFGSPVTAMNFGNLIRSNNPTTGAPNALRGNNNFHVFLGANSSGRRYKVTSVASQLSSGGNVLPNAFLIAPAQVTDGNGTAVTGGTFIPVRSGVGTFDLYTSNISGQAAVIESVYGISGGNADGSAPFTGWQPIPPTQAAGTYSGTITYTITLI